MFTSLFRPRTKPKHIPISQHDTDADNDSPDSDDTSTLLHSSSPPPSTFLKNNLNAQTHRDLRVAIKTLLLCTLVYLSTGIYVLFSLQKRGFVVDIDEVCMGHVSRYSPVVKAVKPGWHDQLFNGTFLHENVYRGPAGQETDAAWEELGVGYRSVLVPPEEAEKTGLRHDQVKVSEEFGGGYPANVEGLHHLHCLDLLRKSLHWNIEHYMAEKKGAFVNSEYIVRIHTTHCLDILRQVLMCTPDAGVLGQVWWQPEDEAQPLPFVDFNTVHRCRDYEGIRAWAEAHQLPPEEEVDMSRFYEMPKPGDMVYSAIP